MMEPFIFISDFDGTLTRKDFYEIAAKDFPPAKIKDLEEQWSSGKIGVFRFLELIFKSIGKSEEEIQRDMFTIPFEQGAKKVIEKVRTLGGRFVILSAGADYYIEKLLRHHGIDGIEIISNKGTYQDGGIVLTTDRNSPYFSEISGIDKEKVVSSFKGKYEKIFYAGDGLPDFQAALSADVIFARSKLAELLENYGKEFIRYSDYGEIAEHIK